MCTRFPFGDYLTGTSIQIFVYQQPTWTAITKYELEHISEIGTIDPKYKYLP